MNKRSSRSSKNPGKVQGFIRIIAGNWRGRKLPVHDIEGLRPTTDRVKETVFNWLMNDVRGSITLDCFSGSGSLGFEALSRGAANVTMIEMDNLAANQLKQNLALLNVDNAKLVKQDCLKYLKQHGLGPFDLVFIDPPFRQGLAQSVCELLESQQLLSPTALIYLEVESELKDLKVPENWQLLKQKTAGQVYCRLYRRS